MALPKPITPESYQKTDLKLVRSPTPKRPHTIAILLSILILCLLGLTYLSIRFSRTQVLGLGRPGQTLEQAFLRDGIEGYTRAKQKLKRSVAESLNSSPSSTEGREAYGLAVYLFPELLEKTNFERTVAETNFIPLEKKIESNPLSAESQRHYQDLYSEIWNYENPSRLSPEIAPAAQQVLNVYETLTRARK